MMVGKPQVTETMIEAGLKAYKNWHVLDGTKKLVVDIIEAALTNTVSPLAPSEKK